MHTVSKRVSRQVIRIGIALLPVLVWISGYSVAHAELKLAGIWANEVGMGEVTEKVSVLALGGSHDEPWIDDTSGIICEATMSRGEGNLPLAEIENVKCKLNKQLVEDYTYWFWNNR